jgi:cytoskeletal protein CcmA (bactofilin family)
MFRKRENLSEVPSEGLVERVTSVLGDGTNLTGRLTGRGGVRIEGTFEGEIALNGLLVIGTTGRVTCENVQANNVIVAGALRGNITADKVEIRSTGRVWGDVTTSAFATEEGAFLRGQILMEEKTDLEHPEEDDEEVIESEIILRQQEEPAPPEEEVKEKPAQKTKSKPKAAKAKPKVSKAKKKARPKRGTKAKSK